MLKRRNRSNTTMFLIDLMRRIPRHRKITASELHEELLHIGWKRDLRTIQRQLDEISEIFSNFIDRDDRSKPYGYSWKPNASGLSLPTLSPQESLFLVLAEQHLRYLLPANIMKSMDNFFKTAQQQLGPFENTKKQREWLSKILVIGETQPLIPPKIRKNVLEEVSNALYDNRWLEIHYRRKDGTETAHEIMPLGLAQQGQRLYLVGRFREENGEYTFAAHRILSAKASPLHFDRPEFDLKKYDEAGHFGIGNGARIRLRFCMDKECGEYLRESPLSNDQTCEESDSCYIFTATLRDSGRLQRWLNSFGDYIWDIQQEAIDS